MEGVTSSHGDCSIEALEEYQKVVQMMFSSEQEAKKIFYDYAKQKGFGVRLDQVLYNGLTRYFCRFVCSQSGYREEKHFHKEDRQREERALTRCGCRVKFGIKLNQIMGLWYVSEFIDTHNYELASSKEVPFLRAHRRIDDVQKVDINSYKLSHLRKCQIMDVIEHQNGGFQNVGYILKDLYNFCSREKEKRIGQGDAESVLNLMKRRKENEVDFFCDYQTDDDGHLIALFWADAQSRNDYQCFGDVVLFDSTYRVNQYNMPFIPFVGVNHHGSTTIFGCGVVDNESALSYKWLLSTFLSAMYQNKPSSVITDGCPSMAKAIRTILPETTHRLCSWNIEKNMMRHLHNSNIKGFRALMYNTHDPNDFEKKWGDYIKPSEKLKANKWLKLMYKSKEQWAMAYLKKKSTPRDEK